MSTKALFWALEQQIPGGPKSVLIHLADWYNTHESAAWPTLRQLADKSGWSVGGVRKYLDWLEEHGLVIREKQSRNGRQVANKYRLPVGVLVFQGATTGHLRVPSQGRGGALTGQPSNTIKDTPKDTINCADAQESDMKLEDVLSEKTKTSSEIHAAWKFTPKGCADFWRDMRSLGDNGFQAELLQKDMKMLHQCAKRVGEANFKRAVERACCDWTAFCKYAEENGTAFNTPANPQVAFFVKFVEDAVNFSIEDSGPAPVQPIAKPLTKPKEKVQTKKSATMSPEEWLALQEELSK